MTSRRGALRRARVAGVLLCVSTTVLADLALNDKGYFSTPGLDVIVFSDVYPEGHQTGVTVVQHGVRVAANGDLRLEASPGQWSPVPVAGERRIDRQTQTISQTLSYPDPARNRRGFNPIDYPDLQLTYTVHVRRLGGNAVRVWVDLAEPLPASWAGKVGFNFELFPGDLFGRAWLMDGEAGHFPTQPNGPVEPVGGEYLTAPLAVGRQLVVAPGEDRQRLVIEAEHGELELRDGRGNHNNGWFIVRTRVPAGATRNAVEWVIRPHVIDGWRRQPSIQVSQLGYATRQPKRAIIELDLLDDELRPVAVYRLSEHGRESVREGLPERWEGEFLRYRYLNFDFSDVTAPGMYVVEYGSQVSPPFRIGDDVYDRNVWQPTLEYFLPVQMCHMRVNEKYRVWHGNDHADDARMAPTDHNHFDGYVQGPSTLTRFQPLEPVPGLNAGGWHDAGDYDLRVESQIGTVWLLSQMIEEFGLDYDGTLIDENEKLVEIHVADGKSDVLQQIEHGLLSVLGGWRSLGRLYRGIIVPGKRQYVLLGDASVQTDNRVGGTDDRWVFTEDNPDRELYVAGGLAAASRVMRGYDDELATAALDAARRLFAAAYARADRTGLRAFALSELAQTTRDARYTEQLIALEDDIVANIGDAGWAIAKAMPLVDDEDFANALRPAVAAYQEEVRRRAARSPYGVPYRPRIWGAAWDIQEFGVRQYFFRKAWPDLAPPDAFVNALNFNLGVHPGANTVSFVSGVGARSALVAYGVNRADWSYIPGGVISGTALIRPDLPELKTWPYFWQQTEYVVGGGGTNFMFLVLAVADVYRNGAGSGAESP